jgi:hypothetical protein
MTHAQLKRMGLDAAISVMRNAPIEFIIEVMRDPDYHYRLRGECAKLAAPAFHGSLSASAAEEQDE